MLEAAPPAWGWTLATFASYVEAKGCPACVGMDPEEFPMIRLFLVVLSLALFAGGATEGSESGEARGRQLRREEDNGLGADMRTIDGPALGIFAHPRAVILFFMIPCFLLVRPQGLEPWTR